jgi:hypothetical protein
LLLQSITADQVWRKRKNAKLSTEVGLMIEIHSCFSFFMSSLNLLFILFAFLFQVVLASVLVSIFQCDAVERFGPKYLVALLGRPLGRNCSMGAYSQIRIPEARGRWAPEARLQ